MAVHHQHGEQRVTVNETEPAALGLKHISKQFPVEGIETGYISASFDQVFYLQGYFPVLQIWLYKNYLIPGLHIDTGVGTVTPENIAQIAPLIEAGYR